MKSIDTEPAPIRESAGKSSKTAPVRENQTTALEWFRSELTALHLWVADPCLVEPLTLYKREDAEAIAGYFQAAIDALSKTAESAEILRVGEPGYPIAGDCMEIAGDCMEIAEFADPEPVPKCRSGGGKMNRQQLIDYFETVSNPNGRAITVANINLIPDILAALRQTADPETVPNCGTKPCQSAEAEVEG